MKKTLLSAFFGGLVALSGYTQTRITNNPVTIVGNNSATCASPAPDFFLTTENRFFQVYDLDNYTQIVDTAFFVKMILACQETAGGPYNIVGKVHKISGPFMVSNLTFIADDTLAITYPDSGKYVMTMPFGDGYVLPGDSIMGEFHLPINFSVKFFPGSNGAPQTSPTYFVAPGCSINDFSTVASLGFPGMHMIMQLYVNQRPSMDPNSFMVFKDDDLLFTETDFTDVFVDNDTTDGMTMMKVEALPLYGFLSLNSIPVAVGDIVMTDEIDLLKYSPNAGYFGNDNFYMRAKDSLLWANDSTEFDITVSNWAVSINENEKSGIDVYPNPTSGIVAIKVDDVIEQIKVYDINGKLVLTSLSDESNIDISKLNAGTYFFDIRTKNGKYFEQVVKE